MNNKPKNVIIIIFVIFISIAIEAAIFMGRADFSDIQSEIESLSIEEQLIINTICPSFVMSISNYNECVWREWQKIGRGVPDPQNQLRAFSFAEQNSISTICRSSLRSIPDYRECVWRELDKVAGAAPDPEDEIRRLSVDQQMRIFQGCPSSYV